MLRRVDGTGRLLADDLLGLSSLLVGKACGAVNLFIDKLLVGLVDEWCKENGRGTDESQTPEWNNLDEVVANKGSNEDLFILAGPKFECYQNTYSSRNQHVLNKDNSLRFDDEKVDQLVNITNNSVQCILRNGKVLSWAELRSQASAKNSLTSKLGQDSNTKSDPGELKEVSKNMEVSGSEDEDNDCCVCKTGSSWVVP